MEDLRLIISLLRKLQNVRLFKVGCQNCILLRCQTDLVHSPYSSTPFKFIVNSVPYHLHASLIENCSEPLNRSIQSDMKEKAQGFARLDGVDTETFDRFLQWIYGHHYEVPAVEESEEPHTENNLKIKSRMTMKERKRRQRNPAFSFDDSWSAFSNTSKPQITDYTEAFVAHLKLYVFADEKQVVKLKDLVLVQLGHLLNEIQNQSNPYADIVALLEYTYLNTNKSSTEEPEPLRKFMMELLQCYEPESLVKNTALKSFIIEDGGDLLTDFLEMLHGSKDQSF